MKKVLKKFISTTLFVALILNTLFVQTAFAINDHNIVYFSETQIIGIRNKIEKRFIDDVEKADEFLKNIGISERWLKHISKERKLELYDTTNTAGIINEYFLETPSGSIKKITNEQYNMQKTKVQEAKTRAIDSGVAEETDSYFKKSLIWIGTNDNSGYYAIYTVFEWLTPPRLRGTDALFLSANTGAFDSSTSLCVMEYKQTAYWTTGSAVDEIVEEYDETDTGNILRSTDYIGYKFNLPNDTSSGGTRVTVSDLGILLCCGYYVEHPQLITNFSLYGTYFHRIVTVTSSVSVSNVTEGDISLSLQIQFNKYVVDETITYTPN